MNSSSRPARFAGTRRPGPLKVVYHRLEELKPDAGNPRRYGKRQIRQIAASIEAFGFNVPILIDGNANIVTGHGRLLAARQLGWGEVPTLCLDHLTPAQTRAFMIADNRLNEIGTWDDRLLAEQLRDLSLLGRHRVLCGNACKMKHSLC
jgi:ParB-like chromosome segregation protein Spo0J